MLVALIKSIFRIYPEIGSQWRKRDDPPWTRNPYKVVRAEAGWVGVLIPAAISEYGLERIAGDTIGAFYWKYVPYVMSPETKADVVADRLNPPNKKPFEDVFKQYVSSFAKLKQPKLTITPLPAWGGLGAAINGNTGGYIPGNSSHTHTVDSNSNGTFQL